MVRRFWVGLVLTLAATGPAAAETTADMSEDPFMVEGGHLEVVFEPVFQGQAMVYEAGEQFPYSVVLVHGLGDSGMRDFKELVPALAQRFHVVTFDLPGFGGSSKQNVLYTPALYAAFVKWVVDGWVDGPFAVIGHSLGGAVSLRFAATYPRDLDRLILADVAGILHEVAMSQYLVQTNVGKMLPTVPGGRQEALLRDLTGLIVSKLKKLPIDMDMALGAKMGRDKMMRGNPAAIAAMALLQEDFTRLIEQMEVPTLILWGADDQVTPLRTAKLLEARLPNARLELIPDAGHVVMADQPDLFERRILAELESPARQPAFEPMAKRSSLGDRVGRCENESGVVFVGPYERIEIVGCMGARVLEATTGALVIDSSEVMVEGSVILGDEVGLQVTSSTLFVTGGRIEGKVGIEASNSRLDLAGVLIEGSEAAVQSPDHSIVVVSVTWVDSPHTEHALHGYFNVNPENPL